MISLLLGLLVLVLVVYVAVWLINLMGLPEPVRTVLVIVIAILGLIYLARSVGYGASLHL